MGKEWYERGRTLGRAVAIAATLCAVVCTTRPAQASICIGSPGYGTCYEKLALHPGEFPFAVTVSESDGRVIVVDLFSGLSYRYLRADLAADPEIFASPLGPAVYTGIAWNSSDNQLYWIADAGAGQQLIVTDLAGTTVTTSPIASPAGGQVGDITYYAPTDSFWAADITNDTFFEFLADGSATGASFLSPAAAFPPAAGIDLAGAAFGVGITAVDVGGEVVLDIPVGAPADLMPVEVRRVHTDGLPYGLGYSLNEATTASLAWVTGVAYSSSGSISPAVPTEFVVDAINGQVFEVPLIQAPHRDIANFTCEVQGLSPVLLNWTNTDTYSDIQVSRDGAVIDTLPGSAVSYTDTSALEEGSHVYVLSVRTSLSDPFEDSADCTAIVGPGRFLNAAEHAGSDPLAITVVESTDRVYVVDLFAGTAYRYDKSLNLIDTISSPFGAAVTPGIAWNSTTDTLLWLNGTTSTLQETDLDGVPVGAAVPLLYSGGAVGDLTYDAVGGNYWAADIVQGVYFEFDATGTLTGQQFTGDPGNSITSVGSTGFFDILSKSTFSAIWDRSVRVDSSGAEASFIEIQPATHSGFVNGIAYTTSGSDGEEAEYLVCNDTNLLVEVTLLSQGAPFNRSDANGDGLINLLDGTYTLFFLFGGGPTPACMDAADSDDSGDIDVNDAVYTLEYIFAGGPQPAAPFGACDIDTTADALLCGQFAGCP